MHHVTNSPVNKNNSAGYTRLPDYTVLLFTATRTLTLVQISANMCNSDETTIMTILNNTILECEQDTLWYTRGPVKRSLVTFYKTHM
jgi:hypothetical protein